MTDWLKCNYKVTDGLPGFFLNGRYSILFRYQAESDYRDSVTALTDCEVQECKSWALNIVALDFMPLKSQDSFWLSETFRSNLINEFTSAERTRFILSSPADYQQNAPERCRRMSEPEAERVLRPRINIEENDNILVDGLNQSLLSYLKTNAANDYLYKYHNLTAKEQCRISTVMNSVIDVNDIYQNEEWYGLTKDQAIGINNMYTTNPIDSDSITHNTSLDDILRNAHKNWKVTTNKLLKKITKTSNPEKTAAYTISWHLIKIHMENFNIFEREAMLSEGDFVVKIWGPILETLFSQTSVVLHWGDTLSKIGEESEASRRRMDLRFLCSSGISNDVGDIEFGKKACVTKLYYDKEKLIINGKAQLNEIASIYNGDASEIKLCLMQVLGFEAIVYEMCLEKKGVYVLRKIKEFYVPAVASRVMSDSKDFFQGLSILRMMIIELSIIYNDSLKKKGRMNQATYDNKPNPTIKPIWNTSLWMPPPKPPKTAR